MPLPNTDAIDDDPGFKACNLVLAVHLQASQVPTDRWCCPAVNGNFERSIICLVCGEACNNGNLAAGIAMEISRTSTEGQVTWPQIIVKDLGVLSNVACRLELLHRSSRGCGEEEDIPIQVPHGGDWAGLCCKVGRRAD